MLHNKQAQTAKLEEVVFVDSRYAACQQSGKWDFQKTFIYDAAGQVCRRSAWQGLLSLSVHCRSSKHRCQHFSKYSCLPPVQSQTRRQDSSKPSLSWRPLSQSQSQPFLSFSAPCPTFLQSWRLINSSLMSGKHVCRGFNYSRKLAQLVYNVE